MRVAIINGHPDPSNGRFCAALASAYGEGARQSGHDVRTVVVGALEFPCVRTQDDWANGTLPPQLRDAQEALDWAEHLVIVYPLWLGDVPAYLKAFLEQVARPGLAFTQGPHGPVAGPLKGKSARVIVTMGMPALIYRLFFLKHSLTSLKRNVLGFVGIRPVRETIIGMVEVTDHKKWLDRMRMLGRAAR